MKRHLSTIVILAMFIVGSSVLLYPAISEYINSRNASKVIAVHNEAVEKAAAEELEQLWAEAREYNLKLSQDPSAFFAPERLEGYEQLLDISGAGIMGYIDIDRIKVELPIYHGVDKGVLQIGVGHLEGSSLPVGGSGTHCVLSGHRGLPSAKLFTDLDELTIDDTFTLTILGRKLTYRVDQIKTVKPGETDDLQIVPGKDYCTLLTCTPYGINTHRLLVRGVRVDSQAEQAGIFVPNEAFLIDPLIVTPIAAIPMLAVLLTIVFISDARKKKTNDTVSKEEKDSNED
ncbi:MAG TPA: class C sortase [Ruminococcus sp.]|nr:class C sortase [Ruminococcus sp.]